ncbi:MAG: lipid-A-disaccharide synthase [Candidatus Omnitrophica bacterium]|nr:lipid-A-disaccharide synthase [Candidatus Omnitrophota bacterium]
MPKKRILIICGEASGELHAANLAQKILQINPNIEISGVGGTLLARCGVNVFYDIKNLSAFGLFDVLKKLPRFIALKKIVLEKIKEIKPDLVILVDFSGFNLRVAKRIDSSIPIIYYISPQVWASRIGRVKTIKKYIRKMLVIFKFEEEFYKKYGIDAEFAGHPLLDTVKPQEEKKDFLNKLGLSANKTTIALLPGSRKQEIENVLPIMLQACGLIARNKHDAQFVIAKSSYVDQEIYNRITGKFNLDLKIAEGKTYDCLNAASFCLVCSGTATLETAIMQRPFCIIYKMNTLNYLLYRPQVKVPYIGMVNLVAGEKIVPEFIQYNASPKKIADYVIGILDDPQKLNDIKTKLAAVKNSLGENGASSRAAKIIVDFLGL